jgi:large subunit ribosomal protein L9
MKVILLRDVPSLGNKNEVKKVSDGYARNFLIPQGDVEIATPKAVENIKLRKEKVDTGKQVHQNLLGKNLRSLDGVKISVEEKANEKGHLFAGVHREEISKLLEEQHHIEIDADIIDLEHPIKEVGEHEIKIKNKKIILEIKAKA